jgi:DNA-binding MarR family transcriptional regulator
MEKSWIKLYRGTLDNSLVMKDADHLAVWVWLLMKASWCESECMFDGKRIRLKAGQLPPISRRTIASELHISESKVQRILKSFENEHQIEQQTGRKSRLISILNWDSYQYREQQGEQRVNTKRTTSEHQVNTIKEYKNIEEVKNYSSYKESLKRRDEIKDKSRQVLLEMQMKGE